MSSRRAVFVSRLSSTLVLWGVALWIIFSGFEIGFFCMIGVLGLLGLREFFQMLDHKGLPNHKVTALICGAVSLIGSFYYYSRFGPGQSYDFEMAVILVFLLVVFARQMFERTREELPLETMAYTLFGLLYVIWLFNFVTKIVYVVPRTPSGEVTGHVYVFYLIVLTKFSDMGAYLTGSLVGKHKMIPHISPAKTWEGFCGALAFATLGSYIVFYFLGERYLSYLNWTHATVLGLLLGFAAIIGDLAESIIKRSTGVKDSGSFLPGIGGALDLIDSLLFTAPLLFFYLRLVVRVPL
jgi:phosphatidate cytidylyltransferase